MWFFWSHDRKRAENSTLSSPCACQHFIVHLLSVLTVVCVFLETNSYWTLSRKNWWTIDSSRSQKGILNNLSNFLPNPSHPFFKTNIKKTHSVHLTVDVGPEMGVFWRNAFAELCSRTADRKTRWLTLVNGYRTGGFKEPVEGSLRVLSEEKRRLLRVCLCWPVTEHIDSLSATDTLPSAHNAAGAFLHDIPCLFERVQRRTRSISKRRRANRNLQGKEE